MSRDLREKKPIKFSIGRFNTGLSTILGVVISGVLYGFVTKSSLISTKKFSFVRMKEFGFDKKYPSFRKKLNRYRRWVLKYNTVKTVSYLTSFLEETSNLPHYSLQYPELIQGDKRYVLLEKHSLKIMSTNYSKLNAGIEWFIVQSIAKKYGYKFIKGVHLIKPVYTFNVWDWDSYNCVIQIPSFHNKEMFVTAHASEYMGRLYEVFAKHAIRDSGVEKEFEEIKTKR